MARLSMTGGLLVANAVVSGISSAACSPVEAALAVGCFFVTALPTVERLVEAIMQGGASPNAEEEQVAT